MCSGKEYDAYSLKGEAIIRQVISKNESQSSPPPDPNDTLGFEEKPDRIVIAYLPPDWKDTDKFQPFFNIHLARPTNTFLRVLQANSEARLVPLWIDTTITGKKAWSMAMTLVGMNLSGELKKRTMRMWNQYPKDPATS